MFGLPEHEEIIRERQGTKGNLTWNEVQKLKYTWRVAQELMRQIPIVSGSFRKAIQNITFAGYDIPKGWQVLTHFHFSIKRYMTNVLFFISNSA